MIADRDREDEFAKLVSEVQNCQSCPRMMQSVRVIGPASGTISASILIIGEAPGRLGADASAIPFHGDKAGDNFEKLIEQVGLSRHDFFITNAALCNPKDEKGNNATPSRSEIVNCSGFLKRQIDLVNPKIVVTLGAQALNALRLIETHDLELSGSVRKKHRWYKRTLITLYHPGQRAMIHRSFHNQLTDYQFLAETFRQAGNRQNKANHKPTSDLVAQIAGRLAEAPSGISYFALHKLFYLAEYEYFRRTNTRMTSAYIVRQKEGPYVFEMHIKKLRKAISDLEVWTDRGRLMLRRRSHRDLFSNTNSNELDRVVSEISTRYGAFSDGELKRVVYLTTPMREFLKREKLGHNMFNRALDFSVLKHKKSR